MLTGPLYVGDYAKVEAGAQLRELTVLGSNVVVKGGASLERAVVHDNVFIGPHAVLRGCVVGKNTDVMRAARLEEGSVVGDECVVEEEAFISSGVKVYPFKTIEAGAVVNTSVIWESPRAPRRCSARAACPAWSTSRSPPSTSSGWRRAYATTLKKGSVVTTARDASRAARAFKRAVISALTASAIDVEDLEVSPLPVTRFETRRSTASGGVVLRTTPGDPQSIDIVFLDDNGADLSPAAQRRLERVFSRQEFRRAFPGEIAELSFPARTLDTYAQEVLRTVDVRGVAEAGPQGRARHRRAAPRRWSCPRCSAGIGVDVLTVANRLDERATTETPAQHMAALERLGGLVSSSKAAFGVRFDHVGERIALVDERGRRHPRRPRAARAARPRGRRDALRPDRAAGDDHPDRRAGHALPRRLGVVDLDRARRAHPGRRRAGRGVRRRRPRRLRRARTSRRPSTAWRPSCACSGWSPAPG